MPALNLPDLPPKAELWCRTLLLQATKPVSQHIQEPLLLHFSICAVRTPLRRVKSEDWSIGSENFWKDLEDESHCIDFCERDVSDGDEFSVVDDDMKSKAFSEDVFMPEKKKSHNLEVEEKGKEVLEVKEVETCRCIGRKESTKRQVGEWFAYNAIKAWVLRATFG